MKKKILVLIIVLAAIIVLSGCVNPADTETPEQKEAKSLANATTEGKAINRMQVQLEKLKKCTADEMAGPLEEYFTLVEEQTGVVVTESEKEEAKANLAVSLEAYKLCLPKLETTAKKVEGSKYKVTYKYATPSKLCEASGNMAMPTGSGEAFVVDVDVSDNSTTIAEDDKMGSEEALMFDQFMAASEAEGDCGFMTAALKLSATMGGGTDGEEGAGDADTGIEGGDAGTADDSA